MGNQKGFSAILLSMVVLFLIMSLMGSAGVYFQTLYGQINRAKRQVTAQVVLVNVGRLLQTAHQNFDSVTETCRTPGVLDKPNQVCWGSGANARCVDYSQGGAAHQICFGNKSGASKMELVFQQTSSPRDFEERVKSYYYAFKENFSQSLFFMVSQIQNRANAQTASEAAHLPSLSGAPGSQFAAGLNCAPATASTIYCKRCEGFGSDANLTKCLRVRICLRPGGCTDPNHWISRVFGFINQN